MNSQQTQDIETLLFHSWAILCDAGTTLKQQCFNVSRLLGQVKGSISHTPQNGVNNRLTG